MLGGRGDGAGADGGGYDAGPADSGGFDSAPAGNMDDEIPF